MLEHLTSPFGWNADEIHRMKLAVKELEKGLAEVYEQLSLEHQEYYSSRLEIMKNPRDTEQFWMYEDMIRFIIRQVKEGRYEKNPSCS